MKKVIEWCEHHKDDPPATQDDDSDSRKKSTDIDEWDQKFMQVDVILPSSAFCSEYTLTICRPPTTSTSRLSSMSAARPSRT
jgi:hypothetical protein